LYRILYPLGTTPEGRVKIRLMDLADSPFSTTSRKITAPEVLGKNVGMF